MPFYLQEISVEGIRGINKKLSLNLSKGVNILYGPNGVGKSSILQSIEWCITGNVSYLTASDFKREDAIVNLFNPKKKGEVSLILKDEAGRTIIITRRRRMAKSTTRGTSDLEVNIDGKVLINEEAQNALTKILGITPEDFPKAIYLHQEAIRDIVTMDPEERSRTIDKLLGTIEIRDLSEALDVKRTILSAKKRLQTRIDTLERDKIQFVTRMKERLSSQKAMLMSKGYKVSELSIENLTILTEDIIEDIMSTADQLEAPKPTIVKPEPSTKVIGEILSQMDKIITELDRFRSNAYRAQEERRLRLENLKNQYNQAESELEEFRSYTPESLLSEKKGVDSQIVQFDSRIKELRNILTGLTTSKAKLEASTKLLSSYETRLKEIEQKYGDEKRHLDLIQEKDQKQINLAKKIEKFATYDKLINLALQYIDEVKPKECPVCGQSIDYSSILEKLAREVKVHVSAEMNKLKSEQGEIRKEISEIKESLEEYRRVKNLLTSERTKLESVTREIEGIIKEKIEPKFEIDSKINSINQQLLSIENQRSTLVTKSAELGQKYDVLMRRLRRLKEVQNNMQQEIGSSLIGKELLNIIENEIDKSKEKAKFYESTAQIDAIIGRITKVKEIQGYLKDKEEVEQLEQELPQITKLVEDMKRRIDELTMLENSLESIRQVALQYEKDVVLTTLQSLRDSINRYYNSIKGHPYFSKLQLEIEREEPLLYAVKAIGEDSAYSTYVPTRFSNAQMNIVALSLFLANNEKLAGNLPLLIFDDPSQNLDAIHMKAFANLLKNLTENRQIILATQDENLKNEVSSSIGKMQLLSFSAWSTEGPKVEQ
ncbi:MAG: SMC family ATPase [Nitrososphaerales archaeon]